MKRLLKFLLLISVVSIQPLCTRIDLFEAIDGGTIGSGGPGITVFAGSMMFLSESGISSSFEVVLNTQPTADVVIDLSTSDNTEGTISAPFAGDSGTITFTAINWNIPQTVTVTGVNDLIADGNQPFIIALGAAASTDTDYSGIDPTDVNFTNLDDDTQSPGITVSAGSTMLVSENGASSSFQVVLGSLPTANVTIPVSSSDTTEGTVSTGTLTFTPANWNVPQTITVTGVNDTIADNNQAFTVVLAASTSTDPAYNGLNPSDVNFTNVDDDISGITVNAGTSMLVSESGTSSTFQVVLNSQPSANVNINVTSGDIAEGTVLPGSLTFTSANWDALQTVTVTGVDDLATDGNQPFTVVLAAATSLDGNYNGINPPDVSFTNVDDDAVTPDIVVNAGSSMLVSESSASSSFEAVLSSQPTADVVINVSTSDNTEGTITAPFIADSGDITFTAGNWNIPKTITVSGVDDAAIDGNQPFSILLAAATSTDGNYNGLDPDDVSFINADDDANVPGVTVNAGTTMLVTENGASSSFQVVLESQPSADVTINVSSSDPGEGTVSTGLLTFTNLNWDTPQTVTVTGVDDTITDTNQAFTVILGITASTDPLYNGTIDPPDVSFTNVDDDAAGVTVYAGSSLLVSESGASSSFEVVLNSEPVADVTINVSSSDPGEGTVSTGLLTFTNANWNVAQTVTVTGVNDATADGNQAFTVLLGTTSSTDPSYNGTLDPADVDFINVDDYTAGVTVYAGSSLLISESGTSSSFEVVLNTQPANDVTINVSSSDTGEGTVSAGLLTFTDLNWNTPQTVTVTGVDDSIADGNQTFNVLLGLTASADPLYSGTIDPNDVSFTNVDNGGVAGITVTAGSSMLVSESGATSSFEVVLNTQPADDVTINVSTNDNTEGTITAPFTADSGNIIFTTGNWNIPQTVTVAGVDDVVIDGNLPFTILLAAATSTDTDYNGLDPNDVSFTNADNDALSPGILVTAGSSMLVSENGTTSSFEVVLNSAPTADVTINVSTNDNTEGTITAPFVSDSGNITFTTGNWNTPQTITVAGVDDLAIDGNQAFTILLAAATSTDTDYNGLDPNDVFFNNADDDATDPGITVNAGSSMLVTENGATSSFEVVLDSMPTDDVTINVSTSDNTEGTITAPFVSDSGNITFTNGDWNTPQTITVTGIDDAAIDGNQPFTILLAAATSTDTDYNGLDPNDVSFINADDDANVPGVTVNAGTTMLVTENGATSSFQVVLESQPTADVTINVSSSDPGEGTVSTGLLTFTNVNWDTPQTVTVTGVDDTITDTNQAFTVVLGTTASTDPLYNGTIDPPDVSFTNVDDDTAGVTVYAGSSLLVSESGASSSFEAVLNSEPTANVTINVSSSDPGEGTVSTGLLTFTNANWNVAQTVTVTGVNDATADGNQAFSVLLGTTASTDPSYNGTIDPADVAFINVDDYTAGVTVYAGSSLLVSESGTSSSFEVVLNTQPDNDVTINVSSSDTGEGTVSTGILTFTNANWDTPQTVTVTGVSDAINDGNTGFTVVLGTTASTDPLYNATINPNDVNFINIDDYTAGITVNAGSSLLVSESGTSSSFEVVLNTQPANDVTIAVSSDNTTEGTVSTGLLTFTNLNWDTPQTVTVTGVDDPIADGNLAFNVVLGLTASADPLYSGTIDPNDVSFTNVDDDIIGITVNIGNGLVTSEIASTDTFDIVLNSEPTADVTISTITSLDTGEVTVSPASLLFTTANWNVPKTVTVTGVDDAAIDDIQTITVDLGTASGADYNGLDPGDVTVYNLDNEIPPKFIVMNNHLGYSTTENGASTLILIVMSSAPANNVTLGTIQSLDVAEGIVTSTTNITFTAADWDIPKIIAVTGVSDGSRGDGDIPYTVDLGTATSADPDWNGMDPGDVTVTNMDYVDVTNYTWDQTQLTNFSTISGTGSVITFNSVDPVTYLDTDEGFAFVPVGFYFYYCGVAYNRITVNVNGFASFNQNPNLLNNYANIMLFISEASNPGVGADQFINMLAPWYDDLEISGGASDVYYETTGTPGSRVFTIEWKEAVTVGASDAFSFQIKLYEGTNVIEFVYGSTSLSNPGGESSASIGIREDSIEDGTRNYFIEGITGLIGDSGAAWDGGFLEASFPPLNSNERFSPP